VLLAADGADGADGLSVCCWLLTVQEENRYAMELREGQGNVMGREGPTEVRAGGACHAAASRVERARAACFLARVADRDGPGPAPQQPPGQPQLRLRFFLIPLVGAPSPPCRPFLLRIPITAERKYPYPYPYPGLFLAPDGSQDDLLNTVWVVDSSQLPFYRAERYHQFHHGLGKKFPLVGWGAWPRGDGM
jgi:hypothetical protein